MARLPSKFQSAVAGKMKETEEVLVSEAIGLILLAPITILTLGAGVQAVKAPLDMFRWAREAHYVLTTHHAFITWEDHGEIRIQEMALERAFHPDVYRLSAEGVGDVVFDAHLAELVGGDSNTSTAWVDKGFFAIPDARKVAARVAAARSARIQEVYGIEDP